MTRLVLALLAAAWATPAAAQSIAAAAPIRAGTVIEAVHLTVLDHEVPGSLTDMRDAIGQEARVNLYPDRALGPADLGAPTMIERNAAVALVFVRAGLRITAEGRALSRAGSGEVVRVMNLNSRSTVTGIAVGPGTVEVR